MDNPILYFFYCTLTGNPLQSWSKWMELQGSPPVGDKQPVFGCSYSWDLLPTLPHPIHPLLAHLRSATLIWKELWISLFMTFPVPCPTVATFPLHSMERTFVMGHSNHIKVGYVVMDPTHPGRLNRRNSAWHYKQKWYRAFYNMRKTMG